MTKSKNFWAALAIISLIAAVFSGYSVYNRLTIHFASDTMEIQPKPVPLPTEAEETKKEPAAEVAAAKPEEKIIPPAAKEDKPAAKPQTPKEEPQKVKAIKVHFEYKSASAKNVALTGSFTKWKELKMTKQNGAWKNDVYILPGKYLYHFVVGGKKVLDPARPKGPIGESVIMVEESHPVAGKK